MYIDRINEIIAHFIGIFDTEVDEARMRARHLEGKTVQDNPQAAPEEESLPDDFASRLALADYDPGVAYRAPYYDYYYAKALTFRRDPIDMIEADIPRFRTNNPDDPEYYGRGYDRPELYIHVGPGSAIAHAIQVNLLQDDDFLDMTAGPRAMRDMSYVTEKLDEFFEKASDFTSFGMFRRTDNYEVLQELAASAHTDIGKFAASGNSSLGIEADHDFMIAGQQVGMNAGDQVATMTGHQIGGSWINGQLVEKTPDINDFMPDRGLAKPGKDPEEQEGPLSETGSAGNTLTVAAGANVVANVFALVNTGVMSSVTAVLGNYHQIDSITQSWIYSDRDDVDSVFTGSSNILPTVASNIATFSRTTFDNPADDDANDGAKQVFPVAWRVSMIDGDVSFINWVEQYNFVTDNDVMKVTTMGSDVTVLTGGNALVNLASFLGIGLQYDLVIIGGNVLDMSMISQIAVLYDNDAIRSIDGAGAGTIVQSGNNLIWNQASINNVGANERFDVMPDYIYKTIDHINDRNGELPDGMAADPVFAGKQALNVLYITGNLYDVNYIRQVSVLGDADDVTRVMSDVLKNNQNATVTIDTGSNAVVNSASILDYDSFGSKTYLAGQLYSDAVLIQGGIIENDTTTSQFTNGRLVNEVIAFLDDDVQGNDASADGVFNGGHDLSWSLAHPSDVMQTAVA